LAWLKEVSKCAPQGALMDLEQAFENFFRRMKKGETPGHPKFKSRNRNPGHFRLEYVPVKNGLIHLARIGHVRFMPGEKGYIPDGKYKSVSVTEDHGRWFVSIMFEVPEGLADVSGPIVGLDTGVRELAHLSDGTVIPNPRALERESKRLRKAKLAIARKQRAVNKKLGPCKKGGHREESKRLQRSQKTLARLAYRVANIRKDALHKATTELAKKYSVIVVEDLHGKNMTKACHGKGRAAKAGLNRVILDSGMLRVRPLLAYKMPLHGGRLIVVPAYYTSRRCSSCGSMNDPGSSKTYKCEKCGLVIDRDQNASLNILAKAAASLTVAPDQVVDGESRGANIRPVGTKGRKTDGVKGQFATIRRSGHVQT